MLTVHIFISGVVQGVGYRQFVKSFAKKNTISGWVQNTPEGKVEAVLQGSIENVEKMVKLCWKGPFLSEVKDIAITVLKENETERFSEFTIRKD